MLLHMCRLHQISAMKRDPYETYYREGQRSIGISIMLTIQKEPGAPSRQQLKEER